MWTIITDCRICGGHRPVNSVTDRVCFGCLENEAKIKKLEDGIKRLIKLYEAFQKKYKKGEIEWTCINGFLKDLKALEGK